MVELIFDTYKDFNITDYRCVLSLRDPEDKVKYHDDDEMWNNAENALRKVLDDIGIEYTEEIGEAAFYGPLTVTEPRKHRLFYTERSLVPSTVSWHIF